MTFVEQGRHAQTLELAERGQQPDMAYRIGNSSHIIDGPIAVDCQKQVRSWRLIRSLVKLLLPSCTCHHLEHKDRQEVNETCRNYSYYNRFPKPVVIPSTTPSIITGTLFGFRHGKVSLCIQTNSKSAAPVLLLGLPLPTTLLAKEMRSGLLRIALECSVSFDRSAPLLSMPVWTTYCNGRKAGFAVRRRPSRADMDVLSLMQSVYVGAGIISRGVLNCEDELMYLRAKFERVSGFSDCESFHLIDPDGSTGQELSIFFLRS